MKNAYSLRKLKHFTETVQTEGSIYKNTIYLSDK